MNNQTFWVVRVENDDGYEDTLYYFHSYEKAFKYAKELAIKAEGESMGLTPEDYDAEIYDTECRSWEELVDRWFNEGKNNLIEIPDWIHIYADEFKD